MITYVDTSAIIKLLIDEVGTHEAGLIWDEADVLVSVRVGHVEARAALAAARRQGRITANVSRAAVAGLEVLWSQLSVVEIDDDFMRLAGDLAATHGLRCYDAVHLAAAQLVGADVFSSADRHLFAAASASGFHIANPVDAATSTTETAGFEVDDAPSTSVTKDSGILGIPVPTESADPATSTCRRDPGTSGAASEKEQRRQCRQCRRDRRQPTSPHRERA